MSDETFSHCSGMALVCSVACDSECAWWAGMVGVSYCVAHPAGPTVS